MGTGELTLDFEENSGINAHLVGNREHKVVLFILGEERNQMSQLNSELVYHVCEGIIDDVLGYYIHSGAFMWAFYRVRTLDGVWGYSPCMDPGMKLYRRNCFRAFQRAIMSPAETQPNTISCILLPKIKFNAVKPVLSGHLKEDRLSLNTGQSIAERFK